MFTVASRRVRRLFVLSRARGACRRGRLVSALGLGTSIWAAASSRGESTVVWEPEVLAGIAMAA